MTEWERGGVKKRGVRKDLKGWTRPKMGSNGQFQWSNWPLDQIKSQPLIRYGWDPDRYQSKHVGNGHVSIVSPIWLLDQIKSQPLMRYNWDPTTTDWNMLIMVMFRSYLLIFGVYWVVHLCMISSAQYGAVRVWSLGGPVRTTCTIPYRAKLHSLLETAQIVLLSDIWKCICRRFVHPI